MHAQVAPRVDLVSGAPDDQVLTQHAHRDGTTVGEILDASHRVPILDEDWVVDHLTSYLVGTIRCELLGGRR